MRGLVQLRVAGRLRGRCGRRMTPQSSGGCISLRRGESGAVRRLEPPVAFDDFSLTKAAAIQQLLIIHD